MVATERFVSIPSRFAYMKTVGGNFTGPNKGSERCKGKYVKLSRSSPHKLTHWTWYRCLGSDWNNLKLERPFGRYVLADYFIVIPIQGTMSPQPYPWQLWTVPDAWYDIVLIWNKTFFLHSVNCLPSEPLCRNIIAKTSFPRWLADPITYSPRLNFLRSFTYPHLLLD